MKTACSNFSAALFTHFKRKGKKKKKIKEVMFLSQGAPQNILGRHGNPWRAASPWQASTLTFQQATQHWDGFLGHLKGNGSQRRATRLLLPVGRRWGCSSVCFWLRGEVCHVSAVHRAGKLWQSWVKMNTASSFLLQERFPRCSLQGHRMILTYLKGGCKDENIFPCSGD